MKGLKAVSKLFSLFSVVCLLTSVVCANSGSRFLNLGVGARAIGMGGAFTGLADDASAGYWNPGGLAQTQGTELLTMYDSWIEGMSHIYLGLNKRLESGKVIGGHINYLSAGSITTSDSLGNKLGSVSPSDMSVAFSYATETNSGLLLGGSLKMIQESLGSVSGSGYGVDGGLIYRAQESTNLGFTIQNLGSGVAMQSKTLPLPMTIRAGISYSMMGQGTPMVLNGDLASIDGSMSMSAGGEYLIDNIALRLGLANTNAGVAPSLGFGFNQESLLIDIGMSMLGDFGSSLKLSVIGKFGGAAVSRPKAAAKTAGQGDINAQIKEAIAIGDFDRAAALKKKRDQVKTAGTASPEIEALKKEQAAAIAAEDFNRAAELKNKIAALQQQTAAPAVNNTAKINALQKEKEAAIAAGDFDKAADIKKKIDELR